MDLIPTERFDKNVPFGRYIVCFQSGSIYPQELEGNREYGKKLSGSKYAPKVLNIKNWESKTLVRVVGKLHIKTGSNRHKIACEVVTRLNIRIRVQVILESLSWQVL